MTTLFEVAEKYREQGYFPIPVVSLGLKPNGDKNIRFPDEYKGVTFDRPEQYEGYNGLAIDTGRSGVVAIDVDENPAKGKQGFAALSAAGIELPQTPAVATSWSGGKHFLYRAPEGFAIPSSSDGRLAKDVDVRGNPGVLFVAPTQVGDKSYQWDTRPVPVSGLPELPAEFAQRLLSDRAPYRRRFAPTIAITDEIRARAHNEVTAVLVNLAAAGAGERWEASTVLKRVAGIVLALSDDPDEYEPQILDAYTESGGDDPDRAIGSFRRALETAEPEDLTKWLPAADRSELFWSSRPELSAIRQAAQAGMASPWAVLGALTVRVLADVPPTWRTITGIGDPEGGNLNLYAVLAAESGGGKGIATQVARHLWPSTVHTTEPASGEALPRLFARKTKSVETGEFVNERIRSSVILDVPEFGSLSASGTRTGATLSQRLASAFSGEALSFAVADESRNVDVPANSYRLGVITGIQYGHAGLLLDESATVTGVPQRFIWFPANVAPGELPAVRPTMPAPLKQWTFLEGPSRIEVTDEARRDMEAAQRAKLVGDVSSPLDGHKLYARVKLAYALAVLNGHYSSVRPQDWYLSGLVMEVSDATRQRAVDTLKYRDRKRAEAAGKREGIRKVAADEAAADESLRRLAGNIERGLTNPKSSAFGGGTRRDLAKVLRSDKQPYADDAIDLLLSEGRLIADGDRFIPPTGDGDR